MSTYTDLAGTIPSPLTLEFRDWYETLLAARVAECDVARGTTYYISTSGSSGNNGTSTSTPKIFSDINGLISGSSGNIAILLRQGDEFATTSGINIGKDNVTIGTYGTSSVNGAKPLIHCFTNSIASGGSTWTLENNGSATEGDLYSASRSTAVGWLREKGSPVSDAQRLNPLRYFDTKAEVQVNPWSWTWIGADNKLYVNCGDGVDPNTKVWEYSDASSAADDGVNIAGVTGCLLDGIRVDGWGAYPSASQVTNYGIRISGSMSAKTAVIRNCDAFYTGNHAIGSVTTAGGYLTVIGCRAGYVNDTTWGGGSSTYVWYSDNSTGMEVLVDSCVAKYGALPWETLGNWKKTAPPHQGWYTHSGAGTMALYIMNNCRDTQETWATHWTSTIGCLAADTANLPGTDSDLSTYRAFVLDHRSNLQYGGGMINFIPKVFTANCHYNYRFPASDTLYKWAITDPAGGVHVNTIMTLVDQYGSSQRVLMGSSGSATARIWHPTLTIEGYSASGRSNIFQGLALSESDVSATASELKNGVLQAINSKGLWSRHGNGSGRIQNIACFSVVTTGTTGFSSNAGYQELKSPVDPLSIPPSNVQYAGDGLHLGLEYDFYWRRRPTSPTLGAVEANVDDSATVSLIYQYVQDGIKLRRTTP